METQIYDDLEVCKDFDEIDNILRKRGYTSQQEMYDYLLKRMGVISAQFTGIADDDIDTMFALAKENYLLNHWREQNECEYRY